MDIMIVLCHPRPGSFNHAVADHAVKGLRALHHTVHFHDLYLEEFNPVLPDKEIRRGFSFDEKVLAHTKELEAAGGLIILHPDWWSQPPAVLKGWVDRVLRPGVAYEFVGEDFMKKQKRPLLAGKKALVFCTTHAKAEEHPGLLERLWLEGIFHFCGVEEAACHILYDLFNASPNQRKEWLSFVAKTLRRWFPPGQK